MRRFFGSLEGRISKALVAAAAMAMITGAGNAYAVTTTLTQTTGNPVIYATEIFGTGSNAQDLTLGSTVILTTGAGAAGVLDIGDVFRLTYTLSDGATFGTALGTASLTTTGTVVVSKSKVSGGNAGDTNVVYELSVTTASVATDTIVLAIPEIRDANGVMATAGATIAVDVEIDAVSDAAVTDLPTEVTVALPANQVIATSAAAFTITTTAGVAIPDIDVTTGAVLFDGDETDAVLGTVALADAAGTQDDESGTELNLAALVATDKVDITLVGDFGAASSVYLDLDGDDVADAGEELTISGNEATLSVDGDDAAAALAAAKDLIFVANGTDVISPQVTRLTVEIDLNGAAWYGSAVDGPEAFGELTLNGVTKSLNFALSPNGYFGNLIRLTNPTSTEADFYCMVYNDAGDSVFFPISSITQNGEALSASLAANASSGMIDITDVYNAAVATDDTFDNNGGKLRVDVITTGTAVEVTSISISRDGNSISSLPVE
jgi:hypothetical protein